jgi:caffeoyl-CoA O-methyltransferase
MEFISEELLKYCEKFSEPENSLLLELHRETFLKVRSPRMLSGHLQGRFLSLMSKMLCPSLILEIGTYTGYSALCLAEGLSAGGRLITIDPNEETNAFARSFFQRSDYRNSIELIEGDASRVIPGLADNIDLVFIDADKSNYGLYYDLVLPKLRKGGLIIADNVLWSGKVLEEKKDADTQAIHEFNAKVSADKRVEGILLPLRDGLMMLRKI